MGEKSASTTETKARAVRDKGEALPTLKHWKRLVLPMIPLATGIIRTASSLSIPGDGKSCSHFGTILGTISGTILGTISLYL